MDIFLATLPQLIVLGISLGAIYALIALGFVVIYSVSNVINLAQGEFLMIGALVFVAVVDAATKTTGAGLAVLVGLLVAIIVTGGVGALSYALAFRPAIERRASVQTLIIISMGVSIVLRAFGNLVWGVDPTSTPAFLPGRTLREAGMTNVIGDSLRLGGVALQTQSIWIIFALIVTVTGLFVFFNRTMTGRALRACAMNPDSARLMGVPLSKMSLIAFALSAAIAALAGAIIAPMQPVLYTMGLGLGLRGFVSAIMGGIANPVGAIWGGLLLGIIEAVVGGLPQMDLPGLGKVNPASLREAIAFVILLAVLIIRRLRGANGLGGKRFGL
ncbi:MAG: branched-chain amino acid ABC transporter permease [Anaerolineae bacterium]|nr:branched-chain amino acid ABC transporter permease [Anaerolineae bacterium]